MGAESFLTLQIVDFAEGVDDRVAALLQAGTGITLTYNDGAGTLTIANTGLGGSTGSTDNRILRSDGTGGATVQNSAVTIDDSGNISGLGTVGCGALTASNGTLTASTPVLNLSQTWNSGATKFTGVLVNITDTASASDSLLMDLQVGGASRFGVRKSNYRAEIGADGNGVVLYNMNNNNIGFAPNLGTIYGSFGSFGLSIGGPQAGANASHLASDAQHVLAVRYLTNPQTFRVYNTYTSATNGEWLQTQWASNEARIGTAVGSAGGTQRNTVLGAWNSSNTWTAALAINTTGTITCQGGFELASRTKAAVLASSTAVNSGRFQLSDAGLIGREVYPDGTNWRYASDDSIVT